MNIVEKCCERLASMGLTIAFAESATAGSVAAAFSQTKDSGQVLKGGIICYDACLKEELLKVPKSLIDQFTPESAQVTRALAHNLHTLIQADIYIGITGLTKPGGSETPEKPVGTMFTCIYSNHWEIMDRSEFQGSETEVIDATINHLCDILIRKLGIHLPEFAPI